GTEQTGDAIAEGKNYYVPSQAPRCPQKEALPGNRPGGLGANVFQEYYEGADSQAGKKQETKCDAHNVAEQRQLLLFAPPLIGDFDIGAVVGDLIAYDYQFDARIGVTRRADCGGLIERGVLLPGELVIDAARAFV